ncbi:MAG: LicD family protein [Lachnospiraceae bacterium]
MSKTYDPDTLKQLQQVELEILKDFMDLCDRHGLVYFGIAGTGIGAVRHEGFIPWDDDIDVAMPRRDFERFLKYAKKELSDRYVALNAKNDSRYPMMTTRFMKKGTIFIEEALKGARCPCGIFLDLYVLDNVADHRLAYQLQSWEAWFWSKLLILRCMPTPYLFQTGWRAKLIWTICGAVHQGMKWLRISPQKLRGRCERVCRRYERRNTRRMAFLPDTSPYWNVFDKTKLSPLRKLKFEDTRLNFPNNVEELLTSQYGDYMQMPPEDKRKTHYPYKLKF